MVNTGEEGYGTVEKVARMLDVAALELHFSVGEPKLHAARVDIKSTLKNGARASIFALTGL